MAKKPLYPHVPKKKDPLFPHGPASQRAEYNIDTDRMGDIIISRTDDPGKEVLLPAFSTEVYSMLTQDERDVLDEGRSITIQRVEPRASMLDRLWEAGAQMVPQTLLARGTEKLKHYWVEKNLPYDSWAIVEAFPGGTVRSPFDTKEEAIKREEQITEAYEWKAKLVPSPQEKFPKQHEALKKLYPYKFVEYHDDGDLTIQLLQETSPGSHKLKPAQVIVVTTDGRTFKESDLTPSTIELLAKTEGDPISKYCCSQCGECAPADLLEEGRFLDRITWLREHYEEKHPGMWGEMSPMTIADGGLVKPEHRRLLDLVDEPLPPDAY